MRRGEFNAITQPGIDTARRAVDFPEMGIIADRLRAAIKTDGRSLSELERASGISKAALSRLMNGERDVSLDTAETLFRVLGVEIAFKRPKKSKQ
ncbi:MAG: helix-turn-helix domain-containing protein [Thermoanaerobaculia bacterium]